jgi:hypothetical protein
MIEVQVLIPVSSNAGEAFSPEHDSVFEAFLLDRFGGCSRCPGSCPARGSRAASRTAIRTACTSSRSRRSSTLASSARWRISGRLTTSSSGSTSACWGSPRSSNPAWSPRKGARLFLLFPPFSSRRTVHPPQETAMPSHKLLSGEILEYEKPRGELAEFLQELRAAVDDPTVTESGSSSSSTRPRTRSWTKRSCPGAAPLRRRSSRTSATT